MKGEEGKEWDEKKGGKGKETRESNGMRRSRKEGREKGEEEKKWDRS